MSRDDAVTSSRTFPNLDPTTRWLLIVAVGLTIFYAVMRPLRKKKDPLEKSPSRFGVASQRMVERDMSNLLVELSEMARQVTAQLDTRTLKLEMLLKEADEKNAALKNGQSSKPRQRPTADGTRRGNTRGNSFEPPQAGD